MSEVTEAKKGRGCFFYGCVTVAVLAICAIIAIFFLARFAVKKAVNLFTSPTPVAVAPVRLSPQQGDQAIKRLEDFTRSLQDKKPGEPIEFSSDELDYVVRNSKEANQLRDAVTLVITNNEIHAQLSFPMSLVSPGLSGRFFNGDVAFSVAMDNGALVINPVAVTVNGQDLPPQAFAQFNAQKTLRWPPEPGAAGAALITNLSKFEIKGDKIILHPK